MDKSKYKSFGNKLLVYILGTTFVTFSLTIFFVTKFSYETAQKGVQSLISEASGKYSAEIQNRINQTIVIAKAMAFKFEESLNTDTKLSEQETIAYIKSLLKYNDDILGFWFKIKDKELLFSANMDSKSQNGYDKFGQFNPYIVKSNTGIKVQAGAPYNEEDAWIGGPKKAGKTYITEPYLYDVDGQKVLMATIGIPLYHNGEYFGVCGIDISLDTLNKMIDSVNIFEHAYAFIIDSHGIIVSHPNKTLRTKKLIEVANNDADYIQLLENSKANKDTQFMKISYEDGLESLYYSNPFSIIDTGTNWTFVINAPKKEYLANANFIRNFSITASIVCLVIIAIIIFLIVRKLNYNLEAISTGLASFFRYLNKESNNTEQITMVSNDEFGKMAKEINNNVEIIKVAIEKDNKLIDEVKTIVNKVSDGYLDGHINASTTNDSLNELKNLLNDMLLNLQTLIGKDLNEISDTLAKYTQRDFTARLDVQKSGKIGKELIKMNKMMTDMLQSSQNDGLSLKKSADELSSSVGTLSKNASEQAASLEETAASIDEITGNIQQTSEKAQEMLKVSNHTKTSANEGKNLANDTVKAMEQINETVQNINEAISVIDQIAFQTNILSLNAAVEAATAGEAGKGFAVVAQEVRNLAARSAEAAKEIKELVESATVRADNGKVISGKMIEGFSELEQKIETTNTLIDDVSNAAKEQTIGMTQIADAMNQLDKFTQENAAIADKTNDIAKETNLIALEVVKNVNRNNFEGKNIQGQSISMEQTTKKVPKNTAKVESKREIETEQESEEWENF
ncbi:methyl-accepting chemotaxis protein [Candidatus Marinarcus aquaticus]|uniref:Chemotaxis protein n=1 Tax=Candidatus Marinarcus aquaticus TaxID=2044504 RepID=A0A4Q0XNF0_9BACT|nr:methyl-accepting chemotaxis protein [Candidatus Marinarcus aquaticus]RXJ55439.1 chemotaxis protein [Candidatus Marinarcus aquaticus]